MSNFSTLPDDLLELDGYIDRNESIHNLKPHTEAKIAWHHSKEPRQTDLSIVYLHGFKASHPEGHPVHRNIAKSLEANLYLSRLQEHGLVSACPLQHLTEQKLIQSARHAIAIGQKIGHKTVLMGTSTGGSLALYLAAQPELRKSIAAVILYAPLIRLYGLNDLLLKYKSLRNLFSHIPGKSYPLRSKGISEAGERIWNKSYALQGALALGEFINRYMQPDLFSEISAPVFTGYYYKNNQKQDRVISVNAIKWMIPHLGTPSANIYTEVFPEAGSHVICSPITSRAVSN